MQALKAALKAILINKVGDIFLLFAVAMLCYFNNGEMSIFTASESLVMGDFDLSYKLFGLNLIDFVSVLIVLAAFVKSAQLFFHT